MSRMSYSEKLLDPRWQKKRLEILQRDSFTCRNCSSMEKTLHVHHLNYERGVEPWEYPEYYMVTLCKDCHLEIEANGKRLIESIEYAFRASLTDTFIQNIVRHVFSDSVDIGRMFRLLWEIGDKRVMEMLETEFSGFKNENRVKPIDKTECAACGGPMRLFKQYDYLECATCGYTKKCLPTPNE